MCDISELCNSRSLLRILCVSMTAWVPLRIFIALHPQVSFSFINNTAQVGSALYLRYIEQCSYLGLEESSHSLGEVFRSDQFQYRLSLFCRLYTYICMCICMYVCMWYVCIYCILGGLHCYGAPSTAALRRRTDDSDSTTAP